MYVHVLLVRVVVDSVPLVDVYLWYVLPSIFLEVVGNRDVLSQRRRLNRFLMLLLDLYMVW